MLEVITTDQAPKAIGPYSQAVKYNGLVYVSGQIPINPRNGQLVGGSVAEQTRQVMMNLSAILKESGSGLDRVLKTTVYLRDMREFDEMNQVYGDFFPGPKPARATVEVARLPKDVSIEIEAVAAAT